jgi:hypothetical protein
MQKKIILSLLFLSVVFFTPLAQAASSSVYFHLGDKYVWKVTMQELNDDNSVKNETFQYRMMNITNLIIGADQINLTRSLKTTNDTNYELYGPNNNSIWKHSYSDANILIKDGSLSDKIQFFFNTKNANLTQLQTLNESELTSKLLVLTSLSNDDLIGVYFALVLFMAFVPENVTNYQNSSTINSVNTNTINYKLSFSFGINNTYNKWQNFSVNATNELTYGENSKILIKSESKSTITTINWNATISDYQTVTTIRNYIFDLKYPTTNGNDITDSDTIPGYSPGLMVAMIALTGALMGKKYRKNN